MHNTTQKSVKTALKTGCDFVRNNAIHTTQKSVSYSQLQGKPRRGQFKKERGIKEMKKVEFMAMTAEEKNTYLESMAKARMARLEKPENVKLATAAVEKLNNGKKLNVFEFEALTGIMFSHNMGDKMKDILALSTNCLFNARCLERMANGDSVCSKCYAAALQLFKKGIMENTSYNTIALNEKVIDTALIPDLSEYDELRIEAFGDTGSWIAAANYMNIARENPSVNVTAWTKNPDHYAKAIKNGI